MAPVNFQQKYNQGKYQDDKPADDYCTYVTKMARMTSICDGPHFGNLSSVFKKQEEPNPEVDNQPIPRQATDQRKPRGLFGQPHHLETFKNSVMSANTNKV
ncbi:hypothetical protein IHE45_14G108200 [Dioscorea alata]|uniref:Uncharacterized protein n=1 Tax=Dioscorea alata TaxID=55571 RepID=A0ACB7UU31_DIOAL|nr:hypothetical protein IHE45_14G108200 [Dioscorea alata]